MESMKDKSRIKIGDYVRIDNPEMFVRCGYPLSIQDMRKEIKDNHFIDIEKFIISIVHGEDKVKDFNLTNVVSHKDTYLNKSKTSQAIIDLLAYEMLRHRNFGGRERSIHTKIVEENRGKIVQVNGTKMCVTGNYVAGSGSMDYWSGEYDYEPPYLENQKSHRILSVYIPMDKIIPYGEFVEETMIEECHVTKVSREIISE
jgi:hypothetical protein